MKILSVRDAVATIVFEVLEQQKHSDTVLHQVLNEIDDSQIGRNSIKKEAYGIIERAIELDYIISTFTTTPVRRLKPWVRTALRMGLYEIRYMKQINEATACNETVALVERHGYKPLKSFVNGILRNYCRNPVTELPDLSTQYSMPKWIVELLTESYGKKSTKKILESFLEIKPLTLRVNTTKVSVEEYEKLLVEENISYAPGFYVKEAIRIPGKFRVTDLPGFQEGYFVVQDESSMLPVLVSGIRKGDTVMDLCAAPGGKTFQAAELAGESGLVSSRDLSQYKLDKINENKKRLKVKNVQGKVMDATVLDGDWIEKADVVICDVPCSGIGIIGKKPDIKYQISKESLAELVTLQRKILDNALAYVKPGGTLIYSTCTLNPEENVKQAEWIGSQKGIYADRLDPFLPEELCNSQTKMGMLQILPGIQKSDGFFVARFKKECR